MLKIGSRCQKVRPAEGIGGSTSAMRPMKTTRPYMVMLLSISINLIKYFLHDYARTFKITYGTYHIIRKKTYIH